MKRIILAALIPLLSLSPAHAASGMASVYVQSAAAWEQCSGQRLTSDQAEMLSGLVARHTLETLSADDLLRQVAQARKTLPASCDLPMMQVDRSYFENFILPRVNGPASPQAPDGRITSD